MSGSGRETLPNVREWLRNPPGCPGVPLGCLEVVERLSRMSGHCWEALTNVREFS